MYRWTRLAVLAIAVLTCVLFSPVAHVGAQSVKIAPPELLDTAIDHSLNDSSTARPDLVVPHAANARFSGPVPDAEIVGESTCPGDNSFDGIAVDPSDGDVFGDCVASIGLAGNVTVVSGSTYDTLSNIVVQNDPSGIAIDSSTQRAFVPQQIPEGPTAIGNVSVINTSSLSVVAEIAPDRSTPAIANWFMDDAYDSWNGDLYLTNSGSANVTVVDPSSGGTLAIVRVTPSQTSDAWCVADNTTGNVYVYNGGWNYIAVLNGSTNSYLTSIPVGYGVDDVAVDAENGFVYTSFGNLSEVKVINGSSNSVVTSIGFNQTQQGVVYDATNGYVYAADSVGWLTAIDPNTNQVAAGTVGPGGSSEMAFDSFNGLVVSVLDNEIRFVSPPAPPTLYEVSFEPTGEVDAGTSWGVDVEGFGLHTSTTPDDVQFSLPNGNYSYSVPTVTGYIVSPSAATFTVDGSNDIVPLDFVPTYSVTFAQSNLSDLPAGASWAVTFGGVTEHSTASALSFDNATSGEYNYSVAGRSGYLLSPKSGIVDVDDDDVTVLVTYRVILYNVTFFETGLPTSSIWRVQVNGSGSPASAGKPITVQLPDGPFEYVISEVPGYIQRTVPYSGSGVVSGANFSVTLSFHVFTYKATFTEAGLPNGVSWQLNVTGLLSATNVTFQGNGSVVLSLPNGTFVYQPACDNLPWSPQNQSSNITIAGTEPQTVSVNFTFVSPVIASESGLPKGASWTITLNQTEGGSSGAFREETLSSRAFSFSTNESTQRFYLANGTYSYSVTSATAGWVPEPAKGTLTVVGSPTGTTVSETFSQGTTAPGGSPWVPTETEWVVIGGVLVAACAVVAWRFARRRA